MSYIVPLHKANSIRHALRIGLFSRDQDCLVVAKVNRLEVFEQTSDGLVLKFSTIVHSRIIALQKLVNYDDESAADYLIVVTDRHKYFLLSWDHSYGIFKTEEKYGDEGLGSTNESMNVNSCLIDGSQRCMVLNLFDGLISIIPLSPGKRKKKVKILGDPGLARIKELRVRSSAFLHGSQPLSLALLWEDAHGDVFLSTKEIDFSLGSEGSAELKDTRWVKPHIERASRFLIPVPETEGGLLVVGEGAIMYYDLAGSETSLSLNEPTIFSTWETIDRPRHLLGDDYGNLYMATLDFSGSLRPQIGLAKLGKVSRPSVLIHLDDGLLFIGSHQSDAQVVRLQEGGERVQVLQTLTNISPVLDFSIMDMGNPTGDGPTNEFSSGQARIVTGSGSFENGSLRSIRSGVALHDTGLLAEVEGIKNLFSLSSSGFTDFKDTLLVSCVGETRIFTFSIHGDVEEVESFKSFSLNEETIAASNCPNRRLIQVTGSAARLVDLEVGTVLSEWASPHGNDTISSADLNNDLVLLSIKGTFVYVLDISRNLQVISTRKFGDLNEISCIAVLPTSSEFCALGFWADSSIALYRTQDLEPAYTERLTDLEGAVPRTMLITQLFLNERPTMLVGMADGNVLSFSVDETAPKLANKRSMILGTEQANFQSISKGSGTSSVFALCDHPSLIYGSEGRIIFSAITADRCVAICSFETEEFPDSIMTATNKELRMSTIDKERTTHTQTLSLNTTVRRIAYSKTERLFGLGTIDRILSHDYEENTSRVKLVDEVNFENLDTYTLKENELIECTICARLPCNTSEAITEDSLYAERLIVGTSYLDDDSSDATKGRIIIFEITKDRLLKRMAEVALKGACRCLALYNGFIVAALSRTVVVYRYIHNALESPTMEKVASYRTSNTPIGLVATTDSIVVADIMKSITMLSLVHNQADASEDDVVSTTATHLDPTKLQLTEKARHFAIVWSTALGAVENGVFLLADASGNLLVLQRNTTGVTAEDRRRLEVISEMHLGELVNKIEPVTVEASASAAVIPKAFLGTVDGSMYLYCSIAPHLQSVLMTLQTLLARIQSTSTSPTCSDMFSKGSKSTNEKVQQSPQTPFLPSPGDLDFLSWRAFSNSARTEEAPFRFVDGELIEQFLNLSDEIQADIAKELASEIEGVEELRSIVESLRRVH